jgi:hypothetical protein
VSSRAEDSRDVAYVRQTVPEFEPVYQRELMSEEGELGTLQAASALGEWVEERLKVGAHDAAVGRAFRAVEHVLEEPAASSGRDFAIEFVHVLWKSPEARSLMGPRTLAFAGSDPNAAPASPRTAGIRSWLSRRKPR